MIQSPRIRRYLSPSIMDGRAQSPDLTLYRPLRAATLSAFTGCRLMVRHVLKPNFQPE